METSMHTHVRKCFINDSFLFGNILVEAQLSALTSGEPVVRAREAQKVSICFSFVMYLSGASPLISMKPHLEDFANTSTNVDFPIRRLPEMTTNDATDFRQSASRRSR